MRSESEVFWVRAKNTVGQRMVVTDWHAIIPGFGSKRTPPGTACNVGLAGTMQTVKNSAILSLDGQRHDECVGLVNAWLEDLDQSPGPLAKADEPIHYARPGSTSEDSGR